jgi:hypothetical protein
MCLTSMAYGVNPMIPHPDDRPRCITCEVKPKQIAGNLKKDGSPTYRSECATCYQKKVARKHGVESFMDVLAKNAGFDTKNEYKNSTHPYRKYRKSYCENIDSRLGFTCTTTIHWEGMLDVDHKNGKPDDNRKKNLQTLCKCCHSYKTNISKDYATIGRKKLKKMTIKFKF